MAPPEETNCELSSAAVDAEAAEGVVEATRQPISTVLIIIAAMQTEALPLIQKFRLSEDTEGLFPKGVPWVRYHGKYKNLNINLVWPGKDSLHEPCLGLWPRAWTHHQRLITRMLKILNGVDSVGTVSASLVTYASIQALKPELVINAGTAGGFKAKGASIGDVYLASYVAFHDRRIPIPVFDQYGIGARRSCCTPNLLKEIDLKWGKLSTGDSLDMSPHDEGAILANDAVVKDMEGAAIAYVTDLLAVPSIFIKAVTDIVDGDKPTAEEFLQNLIAVTANLDQAVSRAINFINGKCLSDL